MSRYRVLVAVLTLLVLPLGAGREQTVIPPAANLTATAPAEGPSSLTALLKPYIWGTTVQGQEVKIPQGGFLLAIEIADVHGAKTVETYRVKVRGQ